MTDAHSEGEYGWEESRHFELNLGHAPASRFMDRAARVNLVSNWIQGVDCLLVKP